MCNLQYTQIEIDMKKLIAIVAIATCCFGMAKAQTVNGVKLNELNAAYIELREVKPFLSKKVWIRLEFGQKVLDNHKNAYIKDDNDQPLAYNSALDCVNKMMEYGYELFQGYYFKTDEDHHQKIYILKRK